MTVTDEKKIEEMNCEIAKFHDKYTTDSREWSASDKILVQKYKYHSDWNLLMEVFEKINTIDDGIFKFTIGQQFGIIEYTAIRIFTDTGAERYNFQAQRDTTIGAVHFTAWEFILWYNKQKP